MKKMLVLTCATEERGYLPSLKESATRYGYDLRIVGEGEKWGGFA